MSVIKKISLLIVSFFVLVGFTVPPRPSNGVYDPHGYLKQSVIEKVDGVNKQLATTDKKPQIAVVVVDRLNGMTIEQAALETARSWKVGFSDTNMGALIFVSVKDRKMRIETSDEMATVVTDYQANQLIDAARSDFRNEDYTSGVLKMVDGLLVTIGKPMNLAIDDSIQQKVSRYMSNSAGEQSGNVVSSVLEGLFGLLVFGVMFTLMFARRVRRRRRSSILDDMFWISLLSSSSRSSRRRRNDDDDDFFGGFGGGSSGGSSGGWSGGGFSGGGSSGGW